MKHNTLAATLIATMALFSTAQANATDTLISALGGKVVYDATTNLSWIADANLAASNTFGLTYGVNYVNDIYNPSVINSNGTATWGGAQTWIAAMNSANYLGYSDWRLANVSSLSGGFISTGELGNLFYNGLGQVANQSITTTHNSNYSLFQNVQSNFYWSGTQLASNPLYAWDFATYNGTQGSFVKAYSNFVLAVRTGQVAAVPEADTYAMMLTGLGLMGFMVRRRKNEQV
jgi:hypothetical protein